MYLVRLTNPAIKDLRRMRGSQEFLRVRAAIEGLVEQPRPDNCKKLTDSDPPEWRLRVGAIRIIYTIDDDDREVTVGAIFFRGGGY